MENWLTKLWDYIAFDKLATSLSTKNSDDFLYLYSKWSALFDLVRHHKSKVLDYIQMFIY